jgi:hypothetical protein
MARKFLFNTDPLLPGDILLTRGDTKGSPLIAKVTGGHFSHAMLYVGNSVIHAMPDGVYSKNPQRLLFSTPADMLALRRIGGLSDVQSAIIVDTARYWVGALYSKTQAAAVPGYSKIGVSTSSSKQFCSRLVAQCYMAADVRLVINPDYCSPNDFAKSDLLAPVPGFAIEASEQQIDFTHTKDPNEEIQRATFEWLGKVRGLALRRGLGQVARQGDVGPLVARTPAIDKVVSNYVRASGYLEHFDVDRGINAYRYDKELFLAKFSARDEIMNAIEVERDINAYELHRRGKNYGTALQIARQLPNEYNALILKHESNLLNEVYARISVLDDVEKFLS